MNNGLGLLMLIAIALLVLFAYDMLRWAFSNERRKSERLVERINRWTT